MRQGNGQSRSDQPGQASNNNAEVTAERALLPQAAPAQDRYAHDALAALISSIWRVLRGMGVSADDVAQATRLSFDQAFAELGSAADAAPTRAGAAVAHVVDPLLAALYRCAHAQWRPFAADADDTEAGASSVRYQGELLVLGLLGTLDEPKRISLLLADMEAFSSPEIAALTGLRLDVVYDELRKARKAFARALKRSDQAGATHDSESDARELLVLVRERFSPAHATIAILHDELRARYAALGPTPPDPGSAA
jgi:DNA-directed RNA polymerase specialized sigma24 family protein